MVGVVSAAHITGQIRPSQRLASFSMNPKRENEMNNARPHPSPLPPGEGERLLRPGYQALDQFTI